MTNGKGVREVVSIASTLQDTTCEDGCMGCMDVAKQHITLPHDSIRDSECE